MTAYLKRRTLSLIEALNLDHPRSYFWACLIVPLVFGLISLSLGQDTNWDLRNYHLYNAYAWLTDRIGVDLAPAQLQTYFNPLLDIPYFEMTMHWPARLVGFTMGTFQGLAFVLLLAIIRLTLQNTPASRSGRIAILLAIAGCLSSNFLAQLGNTMGDNSTSLFVLASLLTLLQSWRKLGVWERDAVVTILFAGLLMGCAAGLKLTNSIYAVALCLACLTFQASWAARVRLAFLFGIGVLLGLWLSAGFWYMEMWNRFGNPLFPQFNSLFNNPLASSVWIADTRWLPKGWGEMLLWPFIFTLDPHRVGEIPPQQIGWPILYLLFGWWGYAGLRAKFGHGNQVELEGRSRFLLVFIGLAYLIWMKLFSIYRYLVPLELLTPLAVWILLHRLLPEATARKAAIRVLLLATAVVLVGLQTWARKSWSESSFRVSTPELAAPEKATILFAGGSPMGWMVPFFPKPVAFAAVLSSFPEGPAYTQHLHAMIANRAGPVYVILEANSDFRLDAVRKMNGVFDTFGLTKNQAVCQALRWGLEKLHIHAKVQETQRTGFRCELGSLPEDYRDIAAENRGLALAKSQFLQNYGMHVELDSCQEYPAFMGDRLFAYQFCRVINGTP